MNLSERVYLITGGASGLGEAAVRRLHSRGAAVSILDRSEERAKAIQKELGSDRCIYSECDVTSYESVQAGVDKTVETFGRLDGCINCAGLGPAELTVKRDGKPHSPKMFDFVVKVNLYGVFNTASLCAAAMSKSKLAYPNDGVIINVASIAGIEGQKGQLAYAAGKGGVIGMTLPMARDLARHGIRVVCIAPGIIDTPLMAKATDKVRAGLVRGVPVGRLGKADDFASLCIQIIENGYLNGEVIRMDGGLRFSNL